MKHWGDLSVVTDYHVHLEFTAPQEPRLLAEGMPFVSLLTEIEANSLSERAAELRGELGRIPYSSPLYWWESYSSEGIVTCEYIGQTVAMQLQDRFERHGNVIQLLAAHVNEPNTRVMFRMCSRLDIVYQGRRIAIEHLPPEQAELVIDDVEAWLIYEKQPTLNTHHKRSRKIPWKPFVVETLRLM